MSMASRVSFSDDSRMIKKPLPKSLLLRDYLLDDMSSCSSNGFRSYPRRQCCTTVRFLVEMDLNKNGKLPPKQHRRSIAESKTNWKSDFKPKQSKMLQRASAVMINAFKHFPFAGTGISRKANFLPRSLSQKLLKHGFWKKTDRHNKEVKRLKSFGSLIKEKEITRPSSPSHFSTAVTTTTTAELTSSTSNSYSWSGSDFTATTDSFTTGNSSEVNLAQNDVADDLQENKTNRKRVGATTTTDTATNYSDTTENAKKWQDKHDEQFSPVSVMDFPSDNDNDVDEDDEVSSMFKHKLKHLHVEGTKKLMQRTRRFESVPRLEPVKLEDRIAQLVLKSSTKAYLEFAREENQVEKKAMALLQLIKSTISSHRLLKYEVVEGLLLGFFKERMVEENVSDYEMLKIAKDWMDGQVQDMFLDWESENNRKTYLREMEKGVKWSKYDYEVEKDNIGLEVECEIFNSLVNDVLLELNLLSI